MPISWFSFEYETKSKLEEISSSSKEIVLLTQTFASPSTKNLISDFKSKFNNVNHIVYDAISHSKAVSAFEARYGVRGCQITIFQKQKLLYQLLLIFWVTGKAEVLIAHMQKDEFQIKESCQGISNLNPI